MIEQWFSPVGESFVHGYTKKGWYSSNSFANWYELQEATKTKKAALSVHTGHDLQLPDNCDAGRPVYAIADGAVIYARRAGTLKNRVWSSTWGNLCVIDHGDAVSRSAHLQRFAPGIADGAKVLQGQVIGWIGGTGKTDAYWIDHLHHDFTMTNEGIALLRKLPTYWPSGAQEEQRAAVHRYFTDLSGFVLATRHLPEGQIVRSKAVLNVRTARGLGGPILTRLYTGELAVIAPGGIQTGDWRGLVYPVVGFAFESYLTAVIAVKES